jgi:hypothetical protein
MDWRFGNDIFTEIVIYYVLKHFAEEIISSIAMRAGYYADLNTSDADLSIASFQDGQDF